MTELHVIQSEVQCRVEAISSAHGDWPCRKGCDECCRRLAAVPRVTRHEWHAIATALQALPANAADAIRVRIRDGAAKSRPIVCPLLDLASGTCTVYEARPVACRTYGFFVERDAVLGCHRIERISRERNGVVWGNHAALEARLQSLGPVTELHHWLSGEPQPCASMTP
jgi:Fe-S-cluster containining protein